MESDDEYEDTTQVKNHHTDEIQQELQRKHCTFSSPTICSYFFFPVPIDSSSKLRSVSSRLPFVATERKKDDFDSTPGWIFWVEAVRRLLLGKSRLARSSLGSPEEVGRLLDKTGLLEALPCREELRARSESGCCNIGGREILKIEIFEL